MLVLGADENGLGPKLGPLVVTGLVLEDGNLPSDTLVDSKKLFKRNLRSYAKLEELALGLISEALGWTPADAQELAQALGLKVDLGRAELPRWAEGVKEWDFGVRWLKVKAYSPSQINLSGNKFSLVYKTFLEFLAQARWDEAFLGKVGSRKRYFLPGARVIKETKDKSVYELRGRTVGFYRDAERFSAVAAASIVGKYIRELAMARLNEELGFNGPVPWCSGYPGDPRTKVLLAKIKRFGLWEELVRVR